MDAKALQALLDSATRKGIDQLLSNKLSDALDDAQKGAKIGGFLTCLRHAELIKNGGSRKAPVWVLAE